MSGMDNIIVEPSNTVMENAFFEYAQYVIEDRALPDLRDGLKPVHRRILFAMHEAGNDHNKGYRKSARTVGEVIGKFHPHGDSSVYGAAVRMAQPFSLREPLIDGQGNFGSIDGDNAAAMRYTEMRLKRLASEMFADLHKETIDWEENYDGQEMMPQVLTASFPQLLVNGVDGIAVGMASSIPTHNLKDVCLAAIKLVEQGELSVKEFFDIVQGPDLPTGGLIYGMDGFLSAITKGTGRLRLRSKHEIEERNRGSRLVITEIPYQVNKSTLVSKIADLVKDKTVEGISALRDESNKDGIRIVIDVKSDADPNVIFSTLCKLTNLETSINYNCTVLDGKKPVQMGLIEILKKWLVFRQDVVKKRYIYERKKAQERLHILEGLIKALDRLDEVIALIRQAKDAAEAKTGLMQLLSIDEIQSQSILDMRLQKLTGLELNDIREEHKATTAKVLNLTEIIESPQKIDGVIKEELETIISRYGNDRLTEIGHGIETINHEDMIPREDVFLAITRNGYVKRMATTEISAQNRGTMGKKAIKLEDGDEVTSMYSAHSHDTLMAFTQSGQVYGIKAYQIPEGSLTSKGRHIKNVIEGLEEEIASIVNVPEQSEGKSIVVVTQDGTVKRSALEEYARATRSGGIKGVNVVDGNKIVDVFVCQEHDHLMLVTDEGMAIRFDLEEIRQSGRTSTGVRGIKVNEGGRVVGAYVITGTGNPLPLKQVQRVRDGELVPVEEADTSVMDEGKYLVCIGEKGVGKRTSVSEFGLQSRGGKGVTAFKANGKTGFLKAAFGSTTDQDLVMMASNGVTNRISVESIRETGRSAAGVILMNLAEGAVISSVTLI